MVSGGTWYESISQLSPRRHCVRSVKEPVGVTSEPLATADAKGSCAYQMWVVLKLQQLQPHVATLQYTQDLSDSEVGQPDGITGPVAYEPLQRLTRLNPALAGFHERTNADAVR